MKAWAAACRTPAMKKTRYWEEKNPMSNHSSAIKRRTRRTSRQQRRGFTLIEVLLVLVILVILGSLVTVSIRGASTKGKINAAKAQIGMFQQPLEMYFLDLNQYPSTSQGLEALLAPPSELKNSAKWAGPYLDKTVPLDPWDRPYQYASPGKHNPNTYDVWSLGPDGVDGTADDIGNWQEAVQ
ncbi:MAG: type II secretion system major pseudopilin GspG [Pirellulales bacterium]|nr:type II secretion system major pseudopilin GspG [Pirellulales bacterium]